MDLPSFEEFDATARAQGFDEVLERRWPPSAVLEPHTHPFAVQALVVQGEMWLTCGSEVKHLLPGDTFEIAHGAVHGERYGPQGATFWAARRHA